MRKSLKSAQTVQAEAQVDAPTKAKHKTREQWLQAFVAAARPAFEKAGAPLPKNVRVAIGFTSKGARGKRIGECWSSANSADGTFEIFIVPSIRDGSRVADILTHELVHAAVGIEAGHGPAFGKVARALGLDGKLTATVAGPGWRAWAEPILAKLGRLPHDELRSGGLKSTPKTQTTRMIKCVCTVEGCGYQVRTTRKWLVEVGAPFCGNPDHHDEPLLCDLPTDEEEGE